MPAQKKAAAPAVKEQEPKEPEDPKAAKKAAKRKAADENWAAYAQDRKAAASQLAADQAALINEPTKVSPDPRGDIDQRMAALLKDHQGMGSRP